MRRCFAIVLLCALPLLAQKYSCPRPPKPDLPYLVHADNLVETESAEAKPEENRLSNESPVGRALLGHKRNDTVAVKVPRGPARKLKITKIAVGLQ